MEDKLKACVDEICAQIESGTCKSVVDIVQKHKMHVCLSSVMDRQGWFTKKSGQFEWLYGEYDQEDIQVLAMHYRGYQLEQNNKWKRQWKALTDFKKKSEEEGEKWVISIKSNWELFGLSAKNSTIRAIRRYLIEGDQYVLNPRVQNPPIKATSRNFFITKSVEFDTGSQVFESNDGRPEEDLLLSWDGAITLCEMLAGKSNFKAYVLLKMMRAVEKEDMTAYKLGWEEKSDEQKAEDLCDKMISAIQEARWRIKKSKEAGLRKESIHQLELWERNVLTEKMYEVQALLQEIEPTISLGALTARSTAERQISVSDLREQKKVRGAS